MPWLPWLVRPRIMVMTIVWTIANVTMTTLFEEVTASVTKYTSDDDHGPEEPAESCLCCGGFREGAGREMRR